MIFELFVALVMIAFDGRFLDCPVHAFDLTIGPRMLDFGQPMFDPIFPAAHVEHVRHVFCCWAICVARRESELDAIVGENRMDFVRDCCDQPFQKGGGRPSAGLLDQLHDSEFAGAIDSDIEIEFSLGGLHFCDVDVEKADWVALKLFLRRFIACDLRQPADAVTLQAAMQR